MKPDVASHIPALNSDFRGAAVPARDKPKRPAPFSLRLSEAERTELTRQAGTRSLGAYIREKLLGSSAAPRRTVRKPGPDQEMIARLLAELGRSHLASNLNQIAKAANCGALPVGPDLLNELSQACATIDEMRRKLIAALNIKPEDER